MATSESYPLELVLAVGGKAAEDLGTVALGAALGGPGGALAAPAIKLLIEKGQQKIREWTNQGRLDKELKALEKDQELHRAAKEIATSVVAELGDDFTRIPVLQELSEGMWQSLRQSAKILHKTEVMERYLLKLLRLTEAQQYAVKQFSQTQSLYERLSSDRRDGENEFKRIVHLLLFHHGRRLRKKISMSSVGEGGLGGLDAQEWEADVVVAGYEYELMPSPLSQKHRERIERSLALFKSGNESDPELEHFRKWVLIDNPSKSQ